ncbi:TonB-dependent receptor [Lysobacter sp. A289]
MSRTSINYVFRRSALTVALGLCFASGVATAQSNTAGTIFGSTGEPNATVVIENVDTGLTRQVTSDASGRYTATALPTGEYKVMLQRDGQVLATQENIELTLGGGKEVTFSGAGTGSGTVATELDRIVVTGTAARYIDVSSTDTVTTFTADQLERLPVGRSIESVALLAPGVVQADSRYPGAASFGGSSASENAFYINGYAVTNPLTNLGSTSLPFDGISQMQVLTGGYGAEFGRATGGVVNIVTKRGSNEWQFGGLLTYRPESMRADYRNIYYPDNGTPNDGLVQEKKELEHVNSWSYGVHVGGPIIQDRLFIYASGEIEEQDQNNVGSRPGGATNGASDSHFEIPRWLAKVDWNITNNHIVELTAISDITKQSLDYHSFTYDPGTNDTSPIGSEKTGGYYFEDGGELYIGKYTGYLTDSLTLTALYGEQTQTHVAAPFGYDPSVVYVSDGRSIANPIQRGTYGQLDDPNAYDETSGFRVDLEWRVGDHSLRVGYDRQDSTSQAGEVTAGPNGYRWIYNTCGVGAGGESIPGGGGAVCPGGNGDYVSQYRYSNGGTFSVDQAAYYFEDRWQVTDQILLTLGLRNESFENFNADGEIYAEQKDQWAPRLGASWDVFGDASLKIFANAGRYHLAMPNNVALRGAAGSLYTNEYFAFTGIDPVTGEPLGQTALGDGPYSANREYGQAPDPQSVTASDLESHYQDEFVLGFEKSITANLNGGARYVHRDLKAAIDDMCDYRPAYNWAIGQGMSEAMADNLGNALASCRLFNPGDDNTFMLDDGTGTLIPVALSAADLGFPTLKRMYQGIDFFLERPFDGKWYGRVDYTLSRNYGNAEGQLKSDIGQQDVSQTQDWDHPELMDHSNGYLPNDRRHYLKAYGFYQASPEWRFSAALTASSGRPKNCMGYYPQTPENEEFNTLYAYGGPYYFYCNGEPTPRGSQGRLPWDKKLDLGVAWAPAFANNALEFSFDVFNVFDSQTAQNQIEYGELGGPSVPYQHAGRVISYSTPRNVRFAIRYDFK